MIVGYDISTLQEEEDAGNRFSIDGKVVPVERILAHCGANLIRLRLWIDPPIPYNTLAKTLQMAERVRAAGLDLLLDLHYCDFWADPGKQPTPKAWEGLEHEALAVAVQRYTESVMVAFSAQGTSPAIVQVGNEITNGMLWPLGRIGNKGSEEWDRFVSLLQAGIAGVRIHAPKSRVMLHIDRGADNAGSRRFFDEIVRRSVSFDLIGLSYYPWWHGPLEALRDNLHDLAPRYGKEIVVVETAYPYRRSNRSGAVPADAALQTRHPATIEGQAAFLRDLHETVRSTPNGLGAGIVYWEPAWIEPVEWEPGGGNGWTDLTLFNDRGAALPSLRWAEP